MLSISVIKSTGVAGWRGSWKCECCVWWESALWRLSLPHRWYKLEHWEDVHTRTSSSIVFYIVWKYIMRSEFISISKCFQSSDIIHWRETICGNRNIFFFLPCHLACGILVPQPGIKPEFMAVKVWILTTGPPENSQKHLMLLRIII